MKNWRYLELKETIREAYFDQLAQNQSKEQAIAVVFEDFYFYPEESNRVENLITIIETARIGIEQLGYLHSGEVILLNNHLSEISDELLNSELQVDEVETLKLELEELLNKIKTVEIRSSQEQNKS